MKLRAISIDDDPTSILMVKQLAEKLKALQVSERALRARLLAREAAKREGLDAVEC